MNTILRLERLERSQQTPSPLDAFSDDELVVTLLETCAKIVASYPDNEAATRAVETAERIGADIDRWVEFWKRPDIAASFPAGFNPPLIGNGCGITTQQKARHDEMHYRAGAVRKAIAAIEEGIGDDRR